MGNWGRLAAILLLLVSGGVLITGSDEKSDPPPEPPAVAAQAETVPDEIVVKLKETVTDRDILALGQSVGIELRYNSIHSVESKLMVAKVNPMNRPQILEVLSKSPLVEVAEPQYVFRPDQVPSTMPGQGQGQGQGQAPPANSSNRFVPNDPLYRLQWHLRMIGMEEAWVKTKGKGAIVAVIDTGSGTKNASGWTPLQDFAPTGFVKGYDFADKQDAPVDEDGHGSHVSGTIAESTNNGILGAGVAPEAQIMPLKVLGPNGGTDSDIADAIRYAADHKANVANMSLSGPGRARVTQNAMQYAIKKNLTLVCAAGNTGKQEVRYPAGFKECIVVSAVGPGGMVTFYSTWGNHVDIAGPGGDPKMGDRAQVWQNSIMQRTGFFGRPMGPRVDDFFPESGTSMASPHVTGVAALLVSLGMKDPKEIRSQLRKTVKKYAPADHYGAGILDAAKAVDSVQRSNGTNRNQLWLALAAGVLLYAIRNSLQRKTDPMFFVHQIAIALAFGMFFPVVLESIVGFGSWWNLIGHSVIVPVIFFTTPKLDRTGFWRACAFTVGIVIHLLLDADSGRAPFQVYPQSRILLWMYANAAVGLYFAGSAYLTLRRQDQVPAPALAPSR